MTHHWQDDEEPKDPAVSHTGRPVAVKCKICGKEFGKASIKFHEPQCEKKRAAEETKKEQQRRAMVEKEKPVSYMDHLGKPSIS